jgi:hypothetical protein
VALGPLVWAPAVDTLIRTYCARASVASAAMAAAAMTTLANLVSIDTWTLGNAGRALSNPGG